MSKLKEKGLIVPDPINKVYTSNVKEINEVRIDMHSTKVVCFNCSPFLQKSAPKILESIRWACAMAGDLGAEKWKVGNIKLNVSATENFKDIRENPFSHVPVREDMDPNILDNTELAIGPRKTRLQTTGELANRTLFASGSVYGTSEYFRDLVRLDKKNWEKVTNMASSIIANAWKRHQAKTQGESMNAAGADLEGPKDDSDERGKKGRSDSSGPGMRPKTAGARSLKSRESDGAERP